MSEQMFRVSFWARHSQVMQSKVSVTVEALSPESAVAQAFRVLVLIGVDLNTTSFFDLERL